MTELLTMTGTAISTIGSMLKLSNDIKNAELQRQIADLNMQIANIQNEAASLIKENGDLREKVEKYKNDKEDPLTYNSEDGYYYDKDTKNPYCPFCYESEKLRIHIIKDHCQCPKCKEYFKRRNPVVAVAKGPGWDPYDHL
jgi:NADH pyrophosphatase NudC (nudix superfamily)